MVVLDDVISSVPSMDFVSSQVLQRAARVPASAWIEDVPKTSAAGPLPDGSTADAGASGITAVPAEV